MADDLLAPPTEEYTLEVANGGEAPQAPEPDEAMSKLAPLPPEKEAELQQRADAWVTAVSGISPLSPDFKEQIDAVYNVGTKAMTLTNDSSDRFLSRKPASSPNSPSGQVSGTLAELREEVDELSPKEDTFTERALSFLPFGNSVRKYFHKYETNQAQLNAIIKSLNEGQDTLTKDNMSLAKERRQMWEAMGELKQSYEFLTRVDETIVREIARQQQLGNQKAVDALQGDVLFAVRQRRQDIQTQTAVAIQAYLSMGIIQDNNSQLIRGVDRAKTTTVMALKTAVQVAAALDDQKLVLDQIDALNQTTNALINRTSEMLKETSLRTQQQATSSGVSPETLQKAFDNIKQTLDGIDEFKRTANDQFDRTISELSASMQDVQSYVDRQQGRALQQPAQPAGPRNLLEGM